MCSIKASAEHKQNMEDTMLELLEDCRRKELYCMHNDVEDLIESALNSKLLSINLKSQRLDKEKREVKNIVEQPTKQPEYSLSMGDKHLSTISETELEKVIKSSVENLFPIPSPLRGGFCWFCDSRIETSFANDPNLNSFDDSQNLYDYSPQPQNETYLCELCGNDSHYGYDCLPRFPLVYEQEPCYNQNFSDTYYHIICRVFFVVIIYFDVHQPPKEISIDELKIMMQSYCERINQQCEQEALLAAQKEQELLAQKQAAQEKEEPPQNSDFRQLIGEMCGTKVCEEQKKIIEDTMLELLEDCRQKSFIGKKKVNNIVEQAPKRRTPLMKCLKNFKVIHNESIIPLNKAPQISLVIANTPKEPEYSLSMEDENLSTILETESNEVIKSGVEDLVPIPSESEEFSGELAHIDLIPPGIKEADFDLEEEISLVENLLYDNSSPRPPKELNSEIADTILESLSPSHIPIENSDSHMEEINLFLATDDLTPPGIENDDYDSEGDIYFLEELLSDDPLLLPENESSNFDHHDDLSFPRPPPKSPDVEICFDFEPDTGVLTAKMVEDISEHYVLMPNILPTQPTLCPNIDTLLPFSAKNKDKVFKPGILSYLLVSHQDKITFDFFEIPMMMYGGDIPFLDIPHLHFYLP
nr:hypothetical protein [Tanacetum cinerariifolium]